MHKAGKRGHQDQKCSALSRTREKTNLVTDMAVPIEEKQAQKTQLWTDNRSKCVADQSLGHGLNWHPCVSKRGQQIVNLGLCCQSVDGQKMAAVAAAADTRLVASQSPSPILHAPLNMAYHILVSFHNIMKCIYVFNYLLSMTQQISDIILDLFWSF